MFNKSKDTIQTYECSKCGFQTYIINNTENEHKCKLCGNQMTFLSERPYNSQNGLSAIKNSNTHKKVNNNQFRLQEPIITCPYCQSANTIKISTTAKVVNTAVFGIFGTKRHKNYHCNNCKSDF